MLPGSITARTWLPTYDKIGELYRDSNIVIANTDATANDIPVSVPIQVQGFFTIKFRKAGSTDYSGNRDAEDFVKFIPENAVHKFKVKVENAETPVETEADKLSHDEL
jgi:protein disulfide-isomerase A1